VTVEGSVWLWGASILLGALALVTLFVLHGRWGIGLAILASAVGLLLGVRWLVRVLDA
jgi:hypothetical protein